MPEANAVNFGTAYVEVRAKLDQYEQDLRQAEQMDIESVKRVRSLQGGGGHGISGDTLMHGGELLYTGYRAKKRAEQLAGAVDMIATGWVSVRVAAASAASVIARIVLPVLLVAELGRVIAFLRQIPTYATQAYEYLKNLDVGDLFVSATVGIDNFMRKIPLISHLWEGVRISISEVSDLLGFDNFVKSIREAEEAAAAAENRLAGMAKAAALVKDQSLFDAGTAERRRGLLAGLQGADRIRAEEMFNQEDLIQQGARMASALRQGYDQQVKALGDEKEAGLIDEDQYAEQLKILTAKRAQLTQLHEQDLTDALLAARAAGAARLRDFNQQEALQEAQQVERLMADLAAARARLELDGADERAAMIRIGYGQQIAQAEREGSQVRAGILREIQAARIKDIETQEREATDARIKAIDRDSRSSVREVRQAMTDLQRTRLELGGANSLGLQVFDINADADREGEQLRQRLADLTEAQDDYQASVRAGTRLFTEAERAEARARGAEIERVGTLIGLNEELRKRKIDLARMNYDTGTAQQIDVRNIVAGSLAGGPAGKTNNTADQQLRVQTASRDELVAIRRALDRGVPAVAV